MSYKINRIFYDILLIVLKLIDFLDKKVEFKLLYFLKRILLSFKAEVIFVTKQRWVPLSIAENITYNLKKLGLISAEISSPILAKNKIIHFGTINSFFKNGKPIRLRNSTNKIVVTWYHISPLDTKIKYIPLLKKKIDILHTSNIITKDKLVKMGFDENRIVVIPLGIDLKNYINYPKTKKLQLKKRFKLPSEKIIIGSFQKDGIGWVKGLEPKFIKGPDIFCEVVKKLRDKFDIHVFLTGPARGYVKNKLEAFQIPYTHVILDNYLDIIDCYNVLDLYIISSRAEGGPKALLEAMATGVPIVSTKVGMVPTIIKHGINGFVVDIDDIDQLFQNSVKVIENNEIREKIIKNGLKTVKNYGWEAIAKSFFNKIYKKLLEG
jgi:glycosyltransferase involved in cell wall biosynthesis